MHDGLLPCDVMSHTISSGGQISSTPGEWAFCPGGGGRWGVVCVLEFACGSESHLESQQAMGGKKNVLLSGDRLYATHGIALHRLRMRGDGSATFEIWQFGRAVACARSSCDILIEAGVWSALLRPETVVRWFWHVSERPWLFVDSGFCCEWTCGRCLPMKYSLFRKPLDQRNLLQGAESWSFPWTFASGLSVVFVGVTEVTGASFPLRKI